KVIAHRRTCGADALTQPQRTDGSVDDLDIDDGHVEHPICFERSLPDRLQAGFRFLVRGAFGAFDGFVPGAVAPPKALPIGKAVCREDLHVIAPSATGSGVFRSRAAKGSDRARSAPATASPMIVMTGPARSLRASSEDRSASVPWKRLRPGRLAFSTTATAVSGDRPASISRPATSAATERPI